MNSGQGQLLAVAAAVESDSEHPLERRRGRGPVPPAPGFRSMTGRGVQALVDGQSVAVGGPALLRETGAEVPDAGAAARWSGQGATVLYVLRAGRSPARWPWRMRSGRSPATPSTARPASKPSRPSEGDMMILESLTGTEFDRSFLTMMIAHHRGAIDMATAAQTEGLYPPVIDLAKSIQTSQIRTMKVLLTGL